MDITTLTDNFRVSNREGWYGAFSLTVSAGAPAPWAGLAAWTPATAYDGGSAVTYAGDLYIARQGIVPSTWTSAGAFADDVVGGVSRWVPVGYAKAWAQQPYDLTGAALTFAIQAVTDGGNLVGNGPVLTATSDGNEILAVNAAGGGVRIAIQPDRTLNIPAGLYFYEITATYPSGRKDRVRYGLWTVDQGIA